MRAVRGGEREGGSAAGNATTTTAMAVARHSHPHHLASRDDAYKCHDVHRQTPLTDAVAEIETCARATVFKGCYYSSFSDAIQRLRNARGTASDADEHCTCTPRGHTRCDANSSRTACV